MPNDPSLDNSYNYPYSTPTAPRIVSRLAVALIASGLQAIALPYGPHASPSWNEVISADKWAYPWREPVRLKPGLRTNLQQFFVTAWPVTGTNNWNEIVRADKWIYPLSTPVRLKPGIHPSRAPFSVIDTFWLKPLTAYGPWYQWLSEPVRLKPGLRTNLQQFLAYHPRYLPPANVTARMAVTEVNADIAGFDVDVYTPEPPLPVLSGANVSIYEVPAVQGGVVSVEGVRDV